MGTRQPMPPPANPFAALKRLAVNQDELESYSSQPYLPWDELRYKTPPHGMTAVEWWAMTKLARSAMMRRLPLVAEDGSPFRYALPDQVLQEIEFVSSRLSGAIGTNEQVTDPGTRDRYLVSSLMEEAITSSQMEGASTTRQVARDMLRQGRDPRTRSERMIVNNFRAMQMVGELRNEPMTLDLLNEIQRVVTDRTLDNPAAAGRIQRPDEDRVGVVDEEGVLIHKPPPAAMLPQRLEALCAFANATTSKTYLPPVLRALTLHYMIGYEHPFEDGNGRTARAVFYWSMLRQGFWMTEFLTISSILKQAPSKYSRSFQHVKLDQFDLTYFFTFNLNVLHRAIDSLYAYLARKVKDSQSLRQRLALSSQSFTPRQLTLLEHLVRKPETPVTVLSHQISHDVSDETARTDLNGLEQAGLLIRTKAGKRFVWHAVPDIDERLRRGVSGGG